MPARPADDLETLPAIGPSLANDLRSLGVTSRRQLARRDPERLFNTLRARTGGYQDPCVLYAFRCAVYAARVPRPRPALLKWWNWKERRLTKRGVAPAAVAVCVAISGCRTIGQATAGAAPTVSPSVAALRVSVDSMLADPKWRPMQWGILILDPERGDTLYSRNSGKLFIPASNQKIITSAVALATLGPDFRFSTTVALRGAITAGVLQGDLVVLGSGDPSVSDRMRGDAMTVMRGLADSIAARGISRISGRLTSGNDQFPGPSLGYGWAWDDLDFPYSAGVDELYFNEGFTRVYVRAGTSEGDPVAVTTAPARSFPVVRVLARTSANPRAPRGDRGLTLVQDSAEAGAVVLDGIIAAGDSAELEITYRDHALAYLMALREALGERGIVVEGGVRPRAPWWTPGDRTQLRASDAAPEPPWTPLFAVVSPPLSEVLKAFMKPSQNQIGEILFRPSGRAATGVASPDSAARAVRDQLGRWGVPTDGAVVRDGSGLSRHNVVTPEALARILNAMRQAPAFSVFHDALPIAGLDGTIRGRMRDTPAQNNVHAKTGTLDMVRSLSGYVTTADGRRLIFVALANNWTVPVREVEAVQDAIAVRLAQLRTGGK